MYIREPWNGAGQAQNTIRAHGVLLEFVSNLRKRIPESSSVALFNPSWATPCRSPDRGQSCKFPSHFLTAPTSHKCACPMNRGSASRSRTHVLLDCLSVLRKKTYVLAMKHTANLNRSLGSLPSTLGVALGLRGDGSKRGTQHTFAGHTASRLRAVQARRNATVPVRCDVSRYRCEIERLLCFKNSPESLWDVIFGRRIVQKTSTSIAVPGIMLVFVIDLVQRSWQIDSLSFIESQVVVNEP